MLLIGHNSLFKHHESAKFLNKKFPFKKQSAVLICLGLNNVSHPKINKRPDPNKCPGRIFLQN